MRRQIKNELVEIIKLLEKANATIQTNSILNIDETLSDCQQIALEAGNRIEAEEGENTNTVRLLEEYCELIYQISINPEKHYLLSKKINVQLNKISNSIRYDLPDSKKNIVFLPYKAAMWDSLESVWLAAKDDISCECYVIPIPYFDKNSDGTLGEMHYEGDEYPDYVPVTSWEEYSIAEHHPDVVYIHNPYDGYNRVTSVHPEFYAKNLKNYTDMLVYIPYFVSFNNVPEHLCIVAGTMYADRVIVQSEMMKQTYIQKFRKFEKENNCDGIFGNINEKFLVLGSPKFDKVNCLSDENVHLPDEWKEILEMQK